MCEDWKISRRDDGVGYYDEESENGDENVEDDASRDIYNWIMGV